MSRLRNAFLIAFSWTVLLAREAAASRDEMKPWTRAEIFQAMRRGGFEDEQRIAPRASVISLGEIRLGAGCYRIFRYVWSEEDAERSGRPLDAANLVPVFSCSKRYLGSYYVGRDDGVPKRDGTRIVFRHNSDPAGPVQFTKDGPPMSAGPGPYPSRFFEGNVYRPKFPEYGPMISELKRDGFSGELSGEFYLWPVGEIRSGQRCYRILNYGRDQAPSEANGRSLLKDDRVLILTCSGAYLGSYGDIPDYPLGISGDVIDFSCGATEACDARYGNRIVIDSAGPPHKVVIHGEAAEFQK